MLNSIKKFKNAKWFRNHLYAYKNLVIRNIKLNKGEKVLYNAELFLDTRCNLKCAHCSISHYQNLKDYNKFMSLEQIEKVADQLKQLNCFLCCLVGGELTLRKDLPEIINIFHKRQILPTLITNGYLLNKELLIKLKKAGLFNIGISLNGATPESHDSFVRKKDAFQKALETLDLAIDQGFATSIAVVPTHENISNGEFKKIIEYAQEKGVRINVNYPALAGEFTNNYDELLSKKELEYVRDFFKLANVTSDFTVLADKYQCPAGDKKIYIMPDGSVCPCTFIHISFGNLLEEPLKNIMKRIWETKIFTSKPNNCIVSESKLFNKVYLEPVFNSQTLPLQYKDHPIFIAGENEDIVEKIKNNLE